MKANLSSMHALAQQTALEAGGLLLTHFRSDFKINKKGDINLVTEMDLKAEQLIVSRIRAAFPDHEILAEEQGTRTGERPFKWIIDPLDGTTNYAHGYRFFCVSIALEVEGELTLGVVYDPVTEELFSARRGEGARLNGRPIRVSGEGNLIDSVLGTGFSYQPEEIRENLEHFNRVLLKARAIRRDGSAALDLCYTACGRFDGFWELSLNPWDVAAGFLMVREAGGRVTNFQQRGCTIYDRQILATNGRIHSALAALLAPSAAG